MNYVHINIEAYLNEIGITKKDFCEKNGLNKSVISGVNTRMPGPKTLRKIAKAMGITYDDLVNEEYDFKAQKKYKKVAASLKQNKIYFLEINKGVSPLDLINSIDEINLQFYKVNYKSPVLHIKGDTMKPDVINGDLLILNSVSPFNIKNNTNYLFVLNDDNAGLKKLIDITENDFIFKDNNGEYIVNKNELVSLYTYRVLRLLNKA